MQAEFGSDTCRIDRGVFDVNFLLVCFSSWTYFQMFWCYFCFVIYSWTGALPPSTRKPRGKFWGIINQNQKFRSIWGDSRNSLLFFPLNFISVLEAVCSFSLVLHVSLSCWSPLLLLFEVWIFLWYIMIPLRSRAACRNLDHKSDYPLMITPAVRDRTQWKICWFSLLYCIKKFCYCFFSFFLLIFFFILETLKVVIFRGMDLKKKLKK